MEPSNVPCRNGDTTIHVQNPMAMLHKACVGAPEFATIMQDAYANRAMPWTVILYTDGISPSDPLNKHDGRKLGR